MPAQADIHGFQDSEGNWHFSDHPDDPRFALYLKTDEPPAALPAPYESVATPPLPSVPLSRFDQAIETAAAACQLDPKLVHAVVAVESNYDASAISSRGAIGLMQVITPTGKRFGATNLHDSQQNLRAGTRYLKHLLDRFGGDLKLALAAYNAGEKAVLKAGRKIPPYAETRRYVPAVIERYERLKAQPWISLR